MFPEVVGVHIFESILLQLLICQYDWSDRRIALPLDDVLRGIDILET